MQYYIAWERENHTIYNMDESHELKEEHKRYDSIYT